MSSPARDQWLTQLNAAAADGTFLRATLGHPTAQGEAARKVIIRPVVLRAGPHWSFVWRHPTRDLTRNLEPTEGYNVVASLLGHDFQAATLFTTERTVEFHCRPGRAAGLRVGPPISTEPPNLTHDRPKQRRLGEAARPWMEALGVVSATGAIKAGMEAKHRQIERFVELLDHLTAEAFPRAPHSGEASGDSEVDATSTASARPLTLVDMGCGKGYLTFAAYDFLRRKYGDRAQVRGVELRRELVDAANAAANATGSAGLQFEAGRIADANLESADIVVALHACDTATDDALARGVQQGTALIVAAPCCHQEIRPQLRPPPVLADALRHGILRERQAEFVTDALRAALLEWAGYDTRVFEFIAPEHTNKNLMIAAVRREHRRDPRETEPAVRDLAKFYGIGRQRLAEHLRFRW